MDEIKAKLDEVIKELEEKQSQSLTLHEAANKKINDLKKSQELLANKQLELEKWETELKERERLNQEQVKIDRDRKLQLDSREKLLDADKERIKKYLNI